MGSENVFDSPSGIEVALTSREKFFDLLDARNLADSNGIRLHEFIINGRLILTNTGRIGVAYLNFSRSDLEKFSGVKTKSEFLQLCKSIGHFERSYPVDYPLRFSKCELCGQKWSIRNLHDFILAPTQSHGNRLYHQSCISCNEILKHENEITNACTEAKLPFLKIVTTDYTSGKTGTWPWYKIFLKYGYFITIGHEYGCIAIDWNQIDFINSIDVKNKLSSGRSFIKVKNIDDAIIVLKIITNEITKQMSI